MKIRIELPLPMSVNKMYMYNPHTHQKIYKKEARDWLDQAGWLVQAQRHGLTLDTYTSIDMYFWVPRSNADSHNYKKLIFDGLQHGGLFTDDRYILDCTRLISIDPKNPRVVIVIDDEAQNDARLSGTKDSNENP